jgi:hypothetical protein
MVEIFSFELGKSRQRVKRAEASFVRANELLSQRSSVAVTLDRI